MRLAISLLTITAGRVLRISPSIDGSNAIHQTSPRRGNSAGLIGHVADQALAPRQCFALARFLAGHLGIAGFQPMPRDMRPRQIVEKAADRPRPDTGAKPLVDIGVD